MTTQEKIAVMQAYLAGKRIQAKAKECTTWIYGSIPSWDWSTTEYRIEPEPKYRPWKNEEIPIELLDGTGWTREKGTAYYNKINNLPTDTGYLLQFLEWTHDPNPYTTTKWYPCGVEE